MKNRAVNSKKEKLDEGWIFCKDLPNKTEERDLLSRVVEIGLSMIFENFCYTFGGPNWQSCYNGSK